MKRATLLLENVIYRRAKTLSQKQGKTLKEIVNDLLRIALNRLPTKDKKPFAIPLYHGSGPQKGVDISDRNSLYDLMDLDSALDSAESRSNR